MKSSVKLFTNFEYKKSFLPGVSRQVLFNDAQLQVYRIENYLRNIVIPVPPYRTSFNFLLFITKGTIVQQLEVSSYKLEANSVLLIKQGSITATLEISPDATGFFIVYENEIINRLSLNNSLLNFFFATPFVTLPSKAVKWLAHLSALLEEELNLINGSMEICVPLFRALLNKILLHESPRPVALNRSLDISLRFREKVQRHHLREKTVEYYARQLNISENYLNKCVKEATGKPPKQWINEISILHSQILLQDPSRDIAGIAFELNYQSASYFTRLFKQVTSLSPSAYRRKINVS